jgi:subtilisin family serine protease
MLICRSKVESRYTGEPKRAGKQWLALAAFVSSAVLTGCGGGSGSSELIQPDQGRVLTGVLVDGYIRGARVYLDLRRDGLTDDDPISEPTDAKGNFRLVLPESIDGATLSGALLVSDVPDTASDADDQGKTFAEVGKQPVTLTAPASAFINRTAGGRAVAQAPAVVSTFSTFVVHEMQANQASLTEARDSVRQLFGFRQRDPLEDLLAASSDEETQRLRALARAATVALGDARAALESDLAMVQDTGAFLTRAEKLNAVTQEVRDRVGDLGAIVDQTSKVMLSPRQVRDKLETVQEGSQVVQALHTPNPGTTAQPRARKEALDLARSRAVTETVRYIVVFRDTVGNPAAEADRIMSGRPGRIEHRYERAIRGFAVSLPAAAEAAFLEAMLNNSHVDRVEVDEAVGLRQSGVQASPSAWGLDRTDQRDLPLNGSFSYAASGTGVFAYVIDTGIRASHQDFSGRVQPGYSAFADGDGRNDCNGHGTHVAATLGGVAYGVAKTVSLVPVRVLDCDGAGSLSGVLAGIDWVLVQGRKPAVVNLSLGSSVSSTLDQAVDALINSGFVVAVAAGNSASNACNYSPARVANAITVGATDTIDTRAGFSNFGSCLDLFAPGRGIRSAWKDGDTSSAVLDGTSMASPHVAGVAAQLLERQPTASPIEVSQALKSTASSGKVVSPGVGSPNLLLFANASVIAIEPTPATSTSVSIASLAGRGLLGKKGSWRAEVTAIVRSAAGEPVAQATVTGDFDTGGTGLKCTTGSSGACVILSGNLLSKTAQVVWRVRSVSGTGLSYNAAGNTVSAVTVTKP